MRAPGIVSIAALAAALAAAGSSPAVAQETRAGLVEQQQTEKAAKVRPYEPNGAERAMNRIEEIFAETPSGFYPFFGSVYAGGGFALGPGYRRFYGDRAFWDAKGLFSIRAYKLVELSTESPGHASGRVDLFARTGWRDATAVAFYGTGIDSPKSRRTNFGLQQGYATGGLVVRPKGWAVLNAEVSLEDYGVGDGRGRAPSVQSGFTSQNAPGLDAEPTYIHTATSAGIDWRPATGYARRGGFYELAYHRYADSGESYSFDRLDAQIVQHVPILRENWVLSFRSQLQTTLHDRDVVPYFMLPSLGSGSTLRGYASWRFRDRHSLLGSAEWRWIPNALAFDMALFVDAGTVASRRRDLDVGHVKADVGVGARFHGPAATMMRIELARGGEGMRLVFAGGAAF